MSFESENQPQANTDTSLVRQFDVPEYLDFGTLTQGDTQIQIIRVYNPNVAIEHIQIEQSEENSWFQIIDLRRLYSDEPYPLEVAVVVDTKLLKPGYRYEGWMALSINNLHRRTYLSVEVKEEPIPRLSFSDVARLLILFALVVLIIYLSIRFFLLSRPLGESESFFQFLPFLFS